MKNLLFYLLVCTLVCVACETNSPPVIQQLTSSPSSATVDETIQISVVAIDADGDALTYTWTSDAGTFLNSTGNTTMWKAPNRTGSFEIRVVVSDGQSIVERALYVNVAIPPGTVTGYVYYSGTTIPISGVTVNIGSMQTTTGSDGKFSLNSNYGNQQIQATKDGYDTFTKNVNIIDGANSVIIELTSGIYTRNVFGTISNESGEGIPGIPVVLLNPDNKESNLQTTSDSKGYYQLPSVPQGTRVIVFKQTNPYDEFKSSIFISNSDYPFSPVLIDLSPKVNFSSSKTLVSPYEKITFTDESTNSPTSYYWNFGDNTSSTGQNPSHVYRRVGNYTVSLKVTNNYGSKTKTVVIAVTQADSNCFGCETGTLTYNGYTYKIVKIGTQWWFAENLRTFRYNNTTLINTLDACSMSNPPKCAFDETQGTWPNCIILCNYDIIENDIDKYGLIYKWNAVSSKMLCPVGWHVPTDNDFMQLETLLGMSVSEVEATGYRGTDQAIKLKSTTDWLNSGTGTNSSSFSGLPGGQITINAVLQWEGTYGIWWTASEYTVNAPYEYRAWARGLSSTSSRVWRGVPLIDEGHSVRCIKD